MPQGKASVQARFTTQIDKLRETAENYAKGIRLEEQPKWTQLDLNGWDGDLTDLDGMGDPFDRADIAQGAKDAVKDAESPGNVGDLILSTLQGDFLAAYERAYRARHTSSVRLRAHSAARRFGHGSSDGPLIVGIRGYLEQLEQLSKTDG